MSARRMLLLAALAFTGLMVTVLGGTGLAAAAEQTPGVYVILDGSGSMWGQLPDGTHKITAAREVLDRFSAGDYAGRELAFRVYGHRREGDCTDSELVVDFSAPGEAIEQMAAFARGVNPKGKTPISRSLRAALEDFGERPGEIILVSDGIETCDEDPCALVQSWRDSNVAIRVHVVGLGLEEQERAAMACISEAAGTEFYDAQSADELAAGLAKIQQTSQESSEPLESSWQVLDIIATNVAGERLRVFGTAVAEGQQPIEVGSNGHNKVPPGDYQVTVGVRTRNGNLYQPVSQSVTVADLGDTDATFVVPEPPSVRTRFVELGEKVHVSYVTAYQNGEEVFGFRAKDRTYLDPGSYEFRAVANKDNELSMTESFADGDHKEVVFELTHTVHAKITMVAEGSGIEFVSNFELWQSGEKRYAVHRHNGVQALPGTYELRLPLRLTPYVHPGLVLTAEPEQEFRIEVPVGHVTFTYLQADGSPLGRDERCFLSRREGEKWVNDKLVRTSNRIPLVAGEYRLEGWSHLGSYDEIFFDVTAGDEKEFSLRDSGD